MMDIQNLGSYDSLGALWGKHPEGGHEGDYVYIKGVKHRWNKYDRIWESATTYTESEGGLAESVYSDMHVHGDLHVGGTLYAKDVQSSNCGLFESAEFLRFRIPSPRAGYFALVGNTEDAVLYVCTVPGAWDATERRVSLNAVSVEIDAINQKISDEVNKLRQSEAGVTEGLSNRIEAIGSKADEALARLEYTEADRGKVSKLKVDGEAGEYLGADGAYHALPEAPEYRLSLGDGSSRGSQKITLEGGTQNSFVEIKTSGSGGGFLNITREVPLGSGYYTLERAVGALQSLGLRGGERSGLIISFEASAGKWEDYRYVGDATSDEAFGSVPMWVRYAPEVDTKQIQALIENSQQRIEVAESVDESDRPVSSRAVKAELDGVKSFKLDADTEPTDEGTKVTLTQAGRTVTEFTVAGGGGSATSQATRAVVQAELSHKRIKLGDKVSVKYSFTHYVDGEPDGTGANLTLEVRKGLSKVGEEALGHSPSGVVQSLDLSKYISSADSYSISVVASYEYGGEFKTRRTTTSLSVVNLSIDLYNVVDVEGIIAGGGYRPDSPANLIVTVKGGAKEITMYVDGSEETKEVRTLTGSGGRQTFSLSPRLLSAGSHSVQFVASVDGLKSNSIYLDVLVAGSDQPFVGLLYSRPDGYILGAGETPTLLAHQYEGLSWRYIAVGTSSGGVSKLSLSSPKGESSIVAPRTYQQYSARPMRQGVEEWSYTLEGLRKVFKLDVLPTTMAGIGIKDGAVLELDAEGRSNVEAEPNVWTNGKVSTTFTDVDFASSGWAVSDTQVPVLRLINGAKAEIGYKPFARDAKTRGLTITFEARMTNVRRADEAVISCYDSEADGGFAGFQISPSKVKMPTGGYLEFVDAEWEEGALSGASVGKNLVLKSGQRFDRSTYTIANYTMAEEWQVGETYSVSVWAEVHVGDTGLYQDAPPTIGIYVDGGSGSLGNATIDSSAKLVDGVYKGRWTLTRTFVEHMVRGSLFADGKILTLFLIGNRDKTVRTVIHRVSIVKGTQPPLEWFPAPEDNASSSDEGFAVASSKTIRRDLGLDMSYAYGDFYSLTLVVHPESEEKTVRLYINGVLSKADTYQDTIFAQRTARGILIDSAHADVELRHVRVYETALTDDEVLTNYITDRPSLSEMDELRQRNDVVSDTTVDISYDKLVNRGKAVLTIAMPGGVEQLWGKSTDTKTNYKFDEIIFRSPFGKAYDLKVTDGAMRRQGTSTSTYPIKNLRIYLNRKGFATKVYHNVGVGDEDRWLSFDELNLVKGDISKEYKLEAGDIVSDDQKITIPVHTNIDKGRDYIFSAEVEFTKGSAEQIDVLFAIGGISPSIYDSSVSGYRRMVWKIKGDSRYLGTKTWAGSIYVYLGARGATASKGLRLRNAYMLQADELPEYYKEIPTQEQKGLSDANSYIMRPGAKPMKVINLKTDYADSSMCYNTGTAILLNDYLVKNNPSLKNKGMQAGASARMAIDGLPIDVFTSDSPEGDKRYCGQFQFNNDKSGSGYIFGQSKSDGSEIALEFINNSNPIANFHILKSSVRAQLDSAEADGFDASLEFLFPEKDYTWGTAPENVKQAVVRLWQWVYECTPLGLSPRNMTEAEVKRAFVSEKFKREVSQYFDITNLTMWWVLTDYHLSVDQRVKNTFFRTWGDGIWWLTYYDGDTAFGKRNDAFLAYDYNVNRDTRDLQRSKFAFEGHNSRLWCLVLANLDAELKQSAKTLRATLTNEVYKRVFNSQIMGNWSERQYNKSGIYKYIKPTYTDYNGGGVMNYIFALNGNMYAYRNQLIERRFSMLDAKYLVGQYESDVVACYIGKGNVATQVLATAGDEYYFAWKTQNGKLTEHQGVKTGEVATFTFTGAISQNDPVRLIGASRMRKLDLSTTAPYMQGAWNLNGCKMLEELVAPTSADSPTQWYPMLRGISSLKRIDLTGQKGVTGTEDEQARTFDVSTHTGLQELRLRGTSVRAVKFGEGSLTTLVELPATLTSLRLRSLPKLTISGLQVEDWSKITSLELSNCPQIDWRILLERCTNVERIRIEGVDFVDDGTLLRRLMKIKGLDAKGVGVDTCELVGRCQLSSYIDDSEVRVWRKHFASLDIRQPAYTMVEFDESIADSANISNLDNKTGYKYGVAYRPSGHIKRILDSRFGCLGKQEEKGVMKVCRLHDEDWRRYADHEDPRLATEAVIDGSQGDVWVYEPHYWYKGINDVLNARKYACYTTERPEGISDKVSVVRLSSLPRRERTIMKTNDLDVASSRVSNNNYVSLELEVRPHKMLRLPTVRRDDGAYGVLYLNASNDIVGTVSTDDIGDGQYLVLRLPSDVKVVVFSVPNYMLDDERGIVVWSDSEDIEDIEPYWVEHEATLVASVKSSVSAVNRLGSCYNPDSSGAMVGKSINEYKPIVERRGLRIMSYDERKNITHLAFLKYGLRNISGVVGGREATGYDLRDNLLSIGLIDTNAGGYYEPLRGVERRVSINGNTARILGYDNLWGSIGEFVIGLTAPDKLRCIVSQSDDSSRSCARRYITGWNEAKGMFHERYMDIIPTSFTSPAGSSRYYTNVNTYYQAFAGRDSFTAVSFGGFQGYCQIVYMNGTWWDVKGIGYNHAYASGVRLQYVGRIEVVDSIEVYQGLPNNF